MNLAALTIRGFIRAYRLVLTPVLGANCRFEPSCSAYADEAIGRFGVFEGSRLAVARVLRCHPWGGAGFDPVPEREPGPGRAGTVAPGRSATGRDHG